MFVPSSGCPYIPSSPSRKPVADAYLAIGEPPFTWLGDLVQIISVTGEVAPDCSRLAHTAGTRRGSGFLRRNGLRAWHCVGSHSSQVRGTLHNRLRNARKCGRQIRNRLVSLFEIKRAG